eukprot:9452274-Pyramimonas_sp.AAC.1
MCYPLEGTANPWSAQGLIPCTARSAGVAPPAMAAPVSRSTTAARTPRTRRCVPSSPAEWTRVHTRGGA